MRNYNLMVQFLTKILKAKPQKNYFFNIGLSKEDIFPGHILSPIFHYHLHIT